MLSDRNKNQIKESELVSRINWDYDLSENELLNIIHNKNDTSNIRVCFFIKSLESLTWQELIYLWGIDECNKLYTNRVRKGIFSTTIREEYDGLFYLLRNKTLSTSRRSPEEIEKFRASLLFNRRNCSKSRLF